MPSDAPFTLGDFFRSRQEPGRAGLPIFSVTMNDGLVPRHDLDRRTDSALLPHEHLLVRSGDIAYNTMRMWQGASGLAVEDGMVSPAYVVVAPKAGIDPRFAHHWFKSERMIYLFWAYSHGLTEDRLRLYADDFADVPASPPPLDVQKRMADVLDSWDRAIEQTDRLIAAKRQFLSALIRSVFAAVHDESAGIPDGWRRLSIGALATIVGGGTPDTTEPTFWNGEVLWCTPTDLSALRSRYIDDTERRISAAGLRASSATVLPANSVVLCSRASVGACAINRVPMSTNQGFQSLVPKEHTDATFLYYLVRSAERRLVRVAAGSTFLEFSGRELAKLLVAGPELDEQRRIGLMLSALDDDIDLLAQKAIALRTQKRGLIQKLLTGDWQPGQRVVLGGK